MLNEKRSSFEVSVQQMEVICEKFNILNIFDVWSERVEPFGVKFEDSLLGALHFYF